MCGCGCVSDVLGPWPSPPGRNHFLFTLVAPPPRLGSNTGLLSASAQSSLSFVLALFIYLRTRCSHYHRRESRVCVWRPSHTHTHTPIHRLTHMLCHCPPPVLLNHSCEHNHLLFIYLFFILNCLQLLSWCHSSFTSPSPASFLAKVQLGCMS